MNLNQQAQTRFYDVALRLAFPDTHRLPHQMIVNFNAYSRPHDLYPATLNVKDSK
jgi:hypothetical protein